MGMAGMQGLPTWPCQAWLEVKGPWLSSQPFPPFPSCPVSQTVWGHVPGKCSCPEHSRVRGQQNKGLLIHITPSAHRAAFSVSPISVLVSAYLLQVEFVSPNSHVEVLSPQ